MCSTAVLQPLTYSLVSLFANFQANLIDLFMLNPLNTLDGVLKAGNNFRLIGVAVKNSDATTMLAQKCISFKTSAMENRNCFWERWTQTKDLREERECE